MVQSAYKVVRSRWKVLLLHLLLWWLFLAGSVGTIVAGYLALYRWYVPAERISLPVFFNYSSRTPNAKFSLSAVRPGVSYDISLQLLVPDIAGLSERLGNVMVSTKIEGKGVATSKSTRPTLLIYRSWPVRMALLALRLAPVLMGLSREATMHRVFLAEEFSVPEHTELAFEVALDKPDLPLYQATLELVAHFRGLRYVMYYWRWSFTLAVIGSMSLLSVMAASLAVGVSLYLRLAAAPSSHRSSPPLSDFAHTDTSLLNGARRSLSRRSVDSGSLAKTRSSSLWEEAVGREAPTDRTVPDGSVGSDGESGNDGGERDA